MSIAPKRTAAGDPSHDKEPSRPSRRLHADSEEEHAVDPNSHIPIEEPRGGSIDYEDVWLA
jgi:hypothetical protein